MKEKKNNPMPISEVARLGGLATKKKYGREHYQKMGWSRRKPDDQVSPEALYMRDYRIEFRKRALNAAIKASPKGSKAVLPDGPITK